MSVKRQATTELNHENWDDEDPADDKIMGEFKAASKEVLEKRVIRTAKRRNPISSEATKSVFSGFGGFNKTQKTSFDFLANLTNGSKNVNGSTNTSNSEPATSSGLFSNKSTINSGGLMGAQSSSPIEPLQTTTLSSPFGSTAKSPSSLFSASNNNTEKGSTNTSNSEPATSAGLFSNKSTINSGGLMGAQSSSSIEPFQTSTLSSPSKPSQTTTWSSPFGSTAKSPSSLFSASNNNTASKDTPVPQATPSLGSAKPTQPRSVFGVPSPSTNESKSLSTTNSSPFKIPATPSTTNATVKSTFGATTPAVPIITSEKKSDDKSNENKIKYFSKLKALNEAVSDWINKHVEETPLCILSPIFKDYEKYLKEISEEYSKNKNKPGNDNESTKTPFGGNNTDSSPFTHSKDPKTTAPFGLNNASSSTSTKQDKVSTSFAFANTSSSPLKTLETKSTPPDSKSSVLFGVSNIAKQDTNTSFAFGLNNTESKQETKASPFTSSAGSPITKSDTKATTSSGIMNSLDQDKTISTPFAMNNTGSSMFAKSEKNSNPTTNSPFALNAGSSPLNSSTPKPSPFSTNKSSPENKQPSFSFGMKSPVSDSSKPSSGFSFGVTPLATTSASSPFSSATSTPQNTKAPFGTKNNSLSSPENKQPSLSFGMKSPVSDSSKPSQGFSFGVTPLATTSASSPFSSATSTTQSTTAPFGTKNNSLSSPENKQPSFSFGMKSPVSDSTSSKPSPGFSFGVTPLVTTNASSPFSSATSTTQSTTAPFSFGVGKPFSFSTNNVQQPAGESKPSEVNEDEPPKVEYTPVQEENSVYEKKCKIFVKKDGNFVDKGVGTLYLKKIEGNVKHQLLVRANTNLGTVLLNLVLAEAIPTQRMGKNNVMMVCIPTPDSKPPPTPILIRVKTGEEADELLETLNKYKA